MIFFFFWNLVKAQKNQLSSVSLEKNINIYWCTFNVFTLGIHVWGDSATSG